MKFDLIHLLSFFLQDYSLLLNEMMNEVCIGCVRIIMFSVCLFCVLTLTRTLKLSSFVLFVFIHK
jgi:hypothetical protein